MEEEEEEQEQSKPEEKGAHATTTLGQQEETETTETKGDSSAGNDKKLVPETVHDIANLRSQKKFQDVMRVCALHSYIQSGNQKLAQ